MALKSCLLALVYMVLLSTIHVIQARDQPSSSSSYPLPSFNHPPATSRPKFRYWFPDASIPIPSVQADIAALAEASAGGLEFLGFYNQGFPPISTDWSIYGFGTPTFKELLRGALNATAEHDLVFDFAVGPNTAHGVPAIPGTEGLAMELVYGAKTLAPLGKVGSLPPPRLEFNHGPLNGWIHEPENWGPSELVAVLAAEVVSRGRQGSVERVVLNQASVVDLSNLTKDGIVDWEAPAVSGGGPGRRWELMAFYQRYSNERSCVSVPDASTWIGNGSWMVDHFSAAGAKKATDFWDQHLLDDDEVNGLMERVGMYSWEDSLEMMAPLWWTPDFLGRFEKHSGYNALKYLPVFFQAKNLWNGYGEPYDTSYTFEGQPSDGGKYAEDYRLTLSEGYEEFLKFYQNWAAARGMNHSAQPAYNMPLDMSATIPLVGAPELESLGFSESIDTYRQFTGPAHLFDRNAISTEIGAQRGGSYAQAVPELLDLIRDSFAAGVNTLVIHGFAYGGPYPGTTWPGYTPFQYEFCEMWGPRQPAWRHMNDTMLYAARNSEVLKTGVPKVDLAFYVWKHPWSARTVYRGEGLTAAGYTHEYLGPDNIASTDTLVQDGALALDGPAYRALVLYEQTRITASASAALVRFAEANLPIFIVGSAPNLTVGATGQEAVSENMAKLTDGSFANVRVMSLEAFGPVALNQAGVLPRVTPAVIKGTGDASQLFTMSRSDTGSGLELVYILNRGPMASFSLSFSASMGKVPYILDAWTGEQVPLVAYTRGATGISTNVSLAQQQSAIFAFAERNGDEFSDLVSVVSHSDNLFRLLLNGEGRIEGLVENTKRATAVLSNNTEISIPPMEFEDNSTPIPTMSLGPWNLTVESYGAPTTLSTASVTADIRTISIATPLSTLTPWTQIRGLERISGLGTYRTSFNLPPQPTGTDMRYILQFTGRILNTVRVRVNGALVPPIDPSAPAEGRDITELLKGEGENEVAVEVSSTLFNAIKGRMGDLRSVGMGVRVPRYYTEVNWAEFGLVGDVLVKGLRKVLIT